MSEQKVVVFDLGKVLVDFDYSIAIRRFAERSEAGLEQIQRLIDSPIQIDYESGKITTDEFYAAIRDGAGFRGDRAEFVSIFADIFSPMETMIEFFERLKPFGIPTCVFSNTNEIAIGHIREGFPFYSLFDNYVLSFEEGGMKPDEAIYDVVEQRLANGTIDEVIIALGTDVEGDATGHYLAKRVAKPGVKVTRIAHGLPAGSGLEFADELTLIQALEGRRELDKK